MPLFMTVALSASAFWLLLLPAGVSFRFAYVPSQSMAPTLSPGDLLLVERNPQQLTNGDIILFKARHIPLSLLLLISRFYPHISDLSLVLSCSFPPSLIVAVPSPIPHHPNPSNSESPFLMCIVLLGQTSYDRFPYFRFCVPYA